MNDKVKSKRINIRMPDHLKNQIESASNYYGITQAEFIKDAIKVAVSKIQYGCHIDADKDEIYHNCCIDDNIVDCSVAEDLIGKGKCKKDCEFWRPIKVKK
jgi:hypothetical protein